MTDEPMSKRKIVFFLIVPLGLSLFTQEAIAREAPDKLKKIAENAAIAIFTWVPAKNKPGANGEKEEDDGDGNQESENEGGEDDDQNGGNKQLVPISLGSGVAIGFENKKIKRSYILTAFDIIAPTPNVTVASLVNKNAFAHLDLRNKRIGLVAFDSVENFALMRLPEQLGQVARLRLQGKKLLPNTPVTVFSFPDGKFSSQRAKVRGYGQYVEQLKGQRFSVTKLEFTPAVKNAVGGFVVDSNNHIYGIVTNVFQEKTAEAYSSDPRGQLIGLATPAYVIGIKLVDHLKKKKKGTRN